LRFLLLSSPLLGRFAWQAVGEALRARGHAAETPAWPRLGDIEDGLYARLAAAMAAQAAGEPAVLVAHSGAGALVPAVAAAMATPPRGAVFVDAILPHPARSWFDTVPAEFAAQLRTGAVDGVLPAWNDWWPPGALEELVPDEAARGALVAELEPLPLAWFEEPAPGRALEAPAAYLQLSGAYDEEARVAGRLGWPVVSLPLHHLALVTQPEAVAKGVEGLAALLKD
jgi:hypothetical protein